MNLNGSDSLPTRVHVGSFMIMTVNVVRTRREVITLRTSDKTAFYVKLSVFSNYIPNLIEQNQFFLNWKKEVFSRHVLTTIKNSITKPVLKNHKFKEVNL